MSPSENQQWEMTFHFITVCQILLGLDKILQLLNI